MLTPGDVVELDLGRPAGSEAGLRRPAVVVTAARILSGGPNVVQVVPLTRTIRTSSTEILIDPDEDNRLVAPSSAQCQHVRSVATTRIHQLWQCRTRGPQRGPRDAGAAGGPVAARGS